MKRWVSASLTLWPVSLLFSGTAYADLGEFDGNTDVGRVSLKGTVQYDRQAQQYRIAGSGENIWATEDAFHFLWHRVSGDLGLSASVAFLGTGGHEHRKAGWMIRESLDPNATYVDAMVHGDGLVCLQYRDKKGGVTQEIQSPVKGAASLLLERDGDQFTLSVAKADGLLQPVGTMTIQLSDPVYAGLAVCSHDAARQETAIFSQVQMKSPGALASSQRVLESTLEIVNVETGDRRIVRRAKDHFEAPNWSPDGERLVFNGHGRLVSIPMAGGEPHLIESGLANQCNNDHGFSPDGKWLALSHQAAGKGSLIYVIPSAGGEPRLVTQDGPSYWHGWSPDGKTLAYCAERKGEFDVYTIGVEGGQETRLTTAKGLDDGPEYSPDGHWIYFNSERTGLMKIWRMRPDGEQQEQVTLDDRYADWFAHPSPNGQWLVFLSYDRSVQGHPANKQVTLRLMPASGGDPRVLAHVFGGQGTLNVPSWSPDSSKVAFVSYRLVAAR